MPEVQMKIQQMFGNFHILELAILKHSSTIVILTFTCRMLKLVKLQKSIERNIVDKLIRIKLKFFRLYLSPL